MFLLIAWLCQWTLRFLRVGSVSYLFIPTSPELIQSLPTQNGICKLTCNQQDPKSLSLHRSWKLMMPHDAFHVGTGAVCARPTHQLIFLCRVKSSNMLTPCWWVMFTTAARAKVASVAETPLGRSAQAQPSWKNLIQKETNKEKPEREGCLYYS